MEEETTKQKLILKQYRLAQQTIDYLWAIKEKYGIQSETETLRMVIAQQHSKEFPAYVQERKLRPVLTPKDREMAKIEAQEARKQIKNDKLTDRWTAICLSMDGAEVIPDPNNEGKMVCHYINYGMNGPHVVDETEMFDPLSAMNEETPSLQYHDYLGKTGPAAKERVLKVLNTKTIKSK